MRQTDIGSEDATPEEQAQYERALERTMETIHGDGAGDQIANIVLKAQDLVTGVADAVFMLVRRAENTMGVTGAVVMQLAEDVIDEIISLLVQGGHLSEEEVTEEMYESIVAKAYELYITDKEERGQLDHNVVRDDINQLQGLSAMSNEAAAKAKGLLQPS